MSDTNTCEPRKTFFRPRIVALLVTVCPIVIIALAVVPSLLTVSCWSGAKQLQVRIHLVDADTGKPLAGVPISVFNGSPFFDETRIVPDPRAASAEPQQLVTDEHGRADCLRRFEAGGRDGLLEHSGHVRLTGVWVEVAPAGYDAVLIPVDGQSLRRRDIDDDSPLCVTILFRRKQDK